MNDPNTESASAIKLIQNPPWAQTTNQIASPATMYWPPFPNSAPKNAKKYVGIWILTDYLYSKIPFGAPVTVIDAHDPDNADLPYENMLMIRGSNPNDPFLGPYVFVEYYENSKMICRVKISTDMLERFFRRFV